MANNRKSIKQKKLSGTFKPDRDAGRDDIEWSRITTVPAHPEYFSQYASGLWEKYCQELIDRDDLCGVYLPGLEQFCYACDIAQRSAKELSTTLTTPSKANPAVSPHFRVWQQATKTISDIAAQFGFSPKARLNIPGAEKSGSKDGDKSLLR